jgi:hypothetical protein
MILSKSRIKAAVFFSVQYLEINRRIVLINRSASAAFIGL